MTTDRRRSQAAAALAAVLSFLVLSASAAEPPAGLETLARQALVVDGGTGAVLFEKDADAPFPPASLAKLMTMEVVFDAIESGTLDRAKAFPVSEHAWRTGGAPSGTSTMFAKLKSEVPLDALIQGTIVQAANDAAIIIAEGMSGSEGAFAKTMNETARRIGMTGSVFVNPTGLPAEGQHVTARDLVILARHLEQDHPAFYRTYAQPDFEWNTIFQRNRNPLLAMGIGATGLATGFTEASGYSLVGVTDRGGRKTFVALGGLPGIKERAAEARKILDWANDSFRREVLFKAGATLGEADVYGGVAPSVPLVIGEDVAALIPSDDASRVTARIEYDGPLQAPVRKGEAVGRVAILIDGRPSLARALHAGADVETGTFAGRALDAAHELAFGWIGAL